MRALRKPGIKAKAMLALCLSNITDDEKKAILSSIANHLESDEAIYDALACTGHLFTIAEKKSIGTINLNDLKELYKDKFSKEGQPPRPYYDAIRNSTPHGICPLCGQRPVSTLDHYLPKSKFPIFSITPINLIPACSDCNKTKTSTTADAAEAQTIHPYFDPIDGVAWLSSTVIEEDPPAVVFFVPDPVLKVTETLSRRLWQHFHQLNLAELYMANAARMLSSISGRLNELAADGGAEKVKEHLVAEARSAWGAEPNGWIGATYGALGASDWFWSGGHKLIRSAGPTIATNVELY